MVSATEWAASASMAEEPLSRPATSLAAAMTRLAPMANMTVVRLSPSPPGRRGRGAPGPGSAPTLAVIGLRRVDWPLLRGTS
jgi:hypothetical protein